MKIQNKGIKRLICYVLILGLIAPNAASAASAASADETQYIYLTENTMPKEISKNDVFYVATNSAELSESESGTYLFKIARGGDALQKSSVTLKISDITAKYGDDYKIKIHNNSILGETVNSPKSNQSLVEMITESDDIEETSMLSNDDVAEINETSSDEVVSKEPDTSDVPFSADATSGVGGTYSVDASTLAGAKQLYTGIISNRTPMTSTEDMIDQLSQMGDWITTTVTGATLKLHFEIGESEKYIEIKTINNNESDGNREFMIVLSETEGSTANSAISNAMFTIADDEEAEKAEVFFSSAIIEADEEKAVIEISRTGAINSMVGATIRTEDITASSGKDYSPVNASVVFPFGIETRTLEIPVSRDSITDSVSFKVILEEPIGCKITGTGEAVVNISPLSAASVSMSTYETKKLLSDADTSGNTPLKTLDSKVFGTEINLAAAAATYSAGNHSREWYGSNNFELSGNSWALAHWYLDTGAGTRGSTHYDYLGVAVDWEQQSAAPAYSNTQVYGNVGYTNTDGDWVKLMETTDERWARKTQEFYFPRLVAQGVYIRQEDTGGIWGYQTYGSYLQNNAYFKTF